MQDMQVAIRQLGICAVTHTQTLLFGHHNICVRDGAVGACRARTSSSLSTFSYWSVSLSSVCSVATLAVSSTCSWGAGRKPSGSSLSTLGSAADTADSAWPEAPSDVPPSRGMPADNACVGAPSVWGEYKWGSLASAGEARLSDIDAARSLQSIQSGLLHAPPWINCGKWLQKCFGTMGRSCSLR